MIIVYCFYSQLLVSMLRSNCRSTINFDVFSFVQHSGRGFNQKCNIINEKWARKSGRQVGLVGWKIWFIFTRKRYQTNNSIHWSKEIIHIKVCTTDLHLVEKSTDIKIFFSAALSSMSKAIFFLITKNFIIISMLTK